MTTTSKLLIDISDRLKRMEAIFEREFNQQELPASDAACYLGVSTKTVYNLRSQGELKGYRRGGKLFFIKSQLDEYKQIKNNGYEKQ